MPALQSCDLIEAATDWEENGREARRISGDRRRRRSVPGNFQGAPRGPGDAPVLSRRGGARTTQGFKDRGTRWLLGRSGIP
jgi:hypothetical protein